MVCSSNVDEDRQKLIDVTKRCLLNAIEQAVPGNHIGDISHAVTDLLP